MEACIEDCVEDWMDQLNRRAFSLVGISGTE